MTYLYLYILVIASMFLVYRFGWLEAIKSILRILIPSGLIILFNLKAGSLLFKSPILGIMSFIPTAILIFKGSQPLVNALQTWLDRTKDSFAVSNDVVDAELISKEDA